MLRKSYSSEWSMNPGIGSSSSAIAASTGSMESSTIHSSILHHHLGELKLSIADFNDIFEQWIVSRKQVLHEDKQAYLKTLTEEHDLVEALKRQLAGLVVKRQSIVACIKEKKCCQDQHV